MNLAIVQSPCSSPCPSIVTNFLCLSNNQVNSSMSWRHDTAVVPLHIRKISCNICWCKSNYMNCNTAHAQQKRKRVAITWIAILHMPNKKEKELYQERLIFIHHGNTTWRIYRHNTANEYHSAVIAKSCHLYQTNFQINIDGKSFNHISKPISLHCHHHL